MKTEIKTRPILMNGAMVLATLSGAKTQTRRLMKNQPEYPIIIAGDPYTNRYQMEGCEALTEASLLRYCPHGQRGDRLYVRESFSLVPDSDEPAGHSAILYAADGERYGKLTPSIHMPRWASRITLEITAVRVERLHDISTEDIIAEGLSTTLRGYDAECDLRDQWRKLWESTGGDWDANEWLWVINFKRVLP